MSSDTLRIDKWLWQARFAKTRALAADLCRTAVVRVNRVRVTRAHHRLRVGDVLTLAIGDEVRVMRILALGTRRGPAGEARSLYEELPPVPIAQTASEGRLSGLARTERPSYEVKSPGPSSARRTT
jgi:ribosome-associated heat shock protein Hsp15